MSNDIPNIQKLGEESILVYIKCITHLRNLMIKDGKIETFNKLLLRYDRNGANIPLRITYLSETVFPKSHYSEEICNFFTEIICRLDYSNWSFVSMLPFKLRIVGFKFS